MPAESATVSGLPVLVWIHGGGYASHLAFSKSTSYLGCSYQGGSAAQYNGASLVADSLNTVVVVVIQYRLGAFGMSFDCTLSFLHCA